MINVIVNYKEGCLEVESHKFEFNSGLEIEGIEMWLKALLDKCFYGGEKVIIEVRNKEGFYETIEEYYPSQSKI